MTKSTLADLVETGLFGIVGAVAELQESFPRLVERGRSSLEPKLNVAKLVGQFAVTRFENELHKRTDFGVGQIFDFVSLMFGNGEGRKVDSSEAQTGPVSDSKVESVTDQKRNGFTVREVSDASLLPIPGYGTLSAQQIIARLDSLSHVELDQVEQYESSHRNRASIMRSIAAKRE